MPPKLLKNLIDAVQRRFKRRSNDTVSQQTKSPAVAEDLIASGAKNVGSAEDSLILSGDIAAAEKEAVVDSCNTNGQFCAYQAPPLTSSAAEVANNSQYLNLTIDDSKIVASSVAFRFNASSILMSTGVILFILAPLAIALQRWRKTQARRALAVRRCRSISREDAKEIILKMEQLIQRDEGQRGISDIIPGPGELYAAAVAMCSAKKVAILTGFPCCTDYTPPTETDGPLGALAIAKALLHMGKETVLLTDECNEEVLLACASSTDFSGTNRSLLTMESFPPLGGGFDVTDSDRVISIGAEVDLIIAVERAGLNSQGKYLTMRGVDMSQLVAPLDMLLLSDTEGDTTADHFAHDNCSGQRIKSIAIGDGGNELGMGKVLDKITTSTSIANAEQIACVVPANHLIVSSVSNWGGYALVAATALLVALENNSKTANDCIDMICKMLPSDEEELAKCKRIVLTGARDGLTGKKEQSVDGMPIAASISIIQQLRAVAE